MDEGGDYIPRIHRESVSTSIPEYFDNEGPAFSDNEFSDNEFSDNPDDAEPAAAAEDWQEDFLGDSHPAPKIKHYSDRLTAEFKSLMGEANLCLAKGDRGTAKNICLEIIRNIPDSPAPYETLSVIFEEENNLYESVQYGLMSAHLWPEDPMKWYSLAMKCNEIKDDENSKLCMTKALRFSHLTEDKSFIEECMNYFRNNEEEIDEPTAQKFAIGYRKLIKISNGSDKDELIALVDAYETSCDRINKPECWIGVIIPLYKTFPEQVCEKKIVKICEVYLRLQWYTKVVEVLKSFSYLTEKSKDCFLNTPSELESTIAATVESISKDPKEAASPFSSLILSETTSPILRSVLVTALIYLEFDSFTLEELATPLFTKGDPNSEGHLLLQIADAYFHVKNFSAAYPVYEQLANSANRYFCLISHSKFNH